MTDGPIEDLGELLTAFGASTVDEAAWLIDEAAYDVADGRIVTLDVHDPEQPMLVIDTRGVGISFPTTVSDVIALANEIDQMLEADE